MATNSWATGVSGDWTTASDWTGGIVPEGRTLAVIKVTPESSNYTVSVTTPVTVGRLILEQTSATLLDSASFASSDFELKTGKLEVDNGTLAGTVTYTGGKLELDNGTFSNVTWHGELMDYDVGDATLTIEGGLTVTPVSGSGTGTAIISAKLVLDGVSSLGSTAIRSYLGVVVQSTPTLTLTSTMDLYTPGLWGASGTNLVNDGTVTLSGPIETLYLGDLTGFNNVVNNGTLTFDGETETLIVSSLVNNGQIIDTGGGSFLQPTVLVVNSITNNGTISIPAGNEMLISNAAALQTAGVSSSILLGGTLQLGGTLTTAQLLAFEAGDHLSTTGTDAILATTGLLENAGSTLTVGTTTVYGDLPLSNGEITGGTITAEDGGGVAGLGPIPDPSTSPETAVLLLNDLTLKSVTPTLTINAINFNDVNVTGASTLVIDNVGYFTGGSLSTVATLVAGGYVNLSVVTLRSRATVVSSSSDGSGGTIELGAAQSTAGVTMQLYSSALVLDPGETVSGAQINFYNAGTNDTLSSTGSSSLAATIEASSTVSVTAGSTLSINDTGIYGSGGGATTQIDFQGSLIDNGSVFAGDFVNAGTISGTGSFQLLGLPVTNSGIIDVAGGSFLQSASPSANGTGATSLTNTGTIEVTNGGTLGINLASLTNTGLISVTDGTLLLDGPLTLASLTEIAAPGSQIGVLGSLNLGGGTVTPGVSGVPDFFLATDGLLTNGTLLVQGGQGFTVDGSNDGTTSTGAPQIPDLINNGTVTADYSSVLGTLSGTGTIDVSGTGSSSTGNYWVGLTIAGPVAQGETITLSNAKQALLLQDSSNGAFAGTISGFKVGGSIVLEGKSIQSATFSGNSIVATLSNGGSIVLDTTSALSG